MTFVVGRVYESVISLSVLLLFILFIYMRMSGKDLRTVMLELRGVNK